MVDWATARSDQRDDRDGAGWRARRRSVGLSVSKRAQARLADWVLDTRLEEVGASQVDQVLVVKLLDQMLDDLAARVEAVFGLEDATLGPSAMLDAASMPSQPIGRLGGVVVGIADEGASALLHLAIPCSVLIPYCMKILPQRVGREGNLISRADALAATPLTIEAVLGTVELALSDLRGLALGDILVLDREIIAPSELVLAGGGPSLATGMLTEQSGAKALRLQPRIQDRH